MIQGDKTMIEAPTDPRTRNAFEEAHRARSAALRDFWAWMTGSDSS